MILIVADAFDTHADAVQNHLMSLDEKHFRLNLDVDSLRATCIHHSADGWSLSQGGNTLDADAVKCVWPRRLTVSLNLEQKTNIESTEFNLWKSEWNRCLFGLYAYVRDKFWMNPIGAASLMDNKFHQFKVARDVGFLIPEYIYSNIKEEIIEYANKNKSLALKFMSQEIFKIGDGNYAGIYVNKVDVDGLKEFGDCGENPIVLQKYISKKFEVRHTVVDGRHFSCRINSQESSRANIDWRRYDVPNTPHLIIEPPSDIISKIDKLMNVSGLYYGAFDFIVDEDDKWWYLEVNTAGQWLWIEDLVGLPISATVANVLATRAERVAE